MMGKKLNIPDLDESYYDGIERIVGTKDDTSFLLPTEVLKKRNEFWHGFFEKYAEESVVENDLDLCDTQDSVPHKKSLKFIQHWVDNGTLPYKSNMDVGKESEQSDITKMLTNSSSSSVDTVAYILSNNNTTNKVTTMAIVEGAKQDSVVDLENEDVGSIETMKLVTDTGGRDSNDNVLQLNDESSTENASTICPAEIEKDVTIKRNDEPVINRTPKIDYNKLFTEKLMHFITKNGNRSSYMKENLFNRELNQSSRTNLTGENSECQNDSKRLSQRKKLYSGRDSPVDIVSTIRRSTSIIPREKQLLHPALDSDTIAKRKSKFFKKRRTQQISMYHSRLMNNSTFYRPSETIRKRWSNTKKSSKATLQSVHKLKTQQTRFSSIDGNSSVTKCNNQNMSTSAIADTGNETASSITNASEFKKPNKTVREFRISKLNKITIPQNIKPLVCLKRLSESDIRKYKTPKNSTFNFDHLLRPVVRLKRLPESDIEKYKKLDEVVEDVKNSHSTIYLEQSSVRVTRLSKRNIENNTNSNTLKKDNINSSAIKKNNIPSPIKKNNKPSPKKKKNLRSQTIQIQNDETSNTKRTLRSQSISTNSFRNRKTINLFEDSDSDNSTLLIHECEPFKSARYTSNLHDSSNVSLYRKIGTKSNKIRKNNVSVVSNDEIKISSKHSRKRGNESDSKQKNSFIFLFDDNNDFVKLIPRKTNKTFNNSIGTDSNNAGDNCSMGEPSVTSQSTSSPSRHRATNKFRRWKFRRSTMLKHVHEKFLRNKRDSLSQRMKTNCNNDKNNAQTAKKTKDKLGANNLYFRTQLFDTDSDASSCY